MDIISRQEARERGLKRFFTGKPCKRGHVVERRVSGRECCECNRLRMLKENMTPEQVEKKRATVRAWDAANPEKARASVRAWQQANQRVNGSNPESYARKNEGTKRYEVAVARATPAWSDREACVAIYTEAVLLQASTGEVQHIDHIVPIQSEWCCGLHVPANLRVLAGSENIRKNNRTWPDMPDHLSRSVAYPKPLHVQDLAEYERERKAARVEA